MTKTMDGTAQGTTLRLPSGYPEATPRLPWAANGGNGLPSLGTRGASRSRQYGFPSWGLTTTSERAKNLHVGGGPGPRPSNTQIREGAADGIDDLNESGMRLLESLHGGAQAFQREFEQFRVLLGARAFV